MVFSPVIGQSNSNGTCDYDDTEFLSNIFNLHQSGCYTYADDSFFTSSEEIISHPVGGSLEICNSPGGFSTIQSAKYIEFKPGFNSEILNLNAGFQAQIGLCVDQPSDADSDGVITTEDCDDTDASIGGIGSACNDNDVCTVDDQLDSSCNCVGTFLDSDNDTVCDFNDVCPGFDDLLIGLSCDDGDVCTTGDVYTDCEVCAGTFQDNDNDTVCDADDVCPDFNDLLLGTSCDDGDDCTINDVYTDCQVCEGTLDLTMCPYNLDPFMFCAPIITLNSNFVPNDFSGISYNSTTDKFMAVQNDGPETAIELDRSGNILRLITLTGFDDTEGIAHISGNTYAITEERNRNVVFVDIPPFSTNVQNPGSANVINLAGTGGGNDGLEGISYDAVNDILYVGRETNDMDVYVIQDPISELGNSITPTTSFDLSTTALTYPGSFTDLAGLSFTANNTLLLLSHEGEMLVEVNPVTGALISSVDVSFMNQPEGVTVVNQNEIIIVGEPNEFAIMKRGSCFETFTSIPQNMTTEVDLERRRSDQLTVYPNPFSDQVKIELDLMTNERVRIDVFDLQGKLVKNVIDLEDAQKGLHVFEVDDIDLESGLYFIKVQAGDFMKTHKITKL